MATAAHEFAHVSPSPASVPLTSEGYFSTCRRIAGEILDGDEPSDERIVAAAHYFSVSPDTFRQDIATAGEDINDLPQAA